MRDFLKKLLGRGPQQTDNAPAASPAGILVRDVQDQGYRIRLDLEPVVAERTAAFMADELKSKPLGFYTWSPELKTIFRQDRLLQSRLDGRTMAALRTDQGMAAIHDAYLGLIAGLTNPFEDSVNAASLFPASVSHESSLIVGLVSSCRRHIAKRVRIDDDLQVVFQFESHDVVYPVMAEVYVTKLLDRDEFRRHCDKHMSTDAILANLR